MILTQIIEQKRKEIEDSKGRIPQERLISKIEEIKVNRKPNFFKHAIEKPTDYTS